MGSPIEERMMIALCDVAGWRVHRRTGCNLNYLRVIAAHRLKNREIFIAPQCRVGRYRLDFAVCAKSPGGSIRVIGIECDGHQWHSTPEQIQRDAERDDAIAKQGVEVKRFSGWSIHKDAEACAKLALGELLEFQGHVPLNEPVDAEDNGEWLELSRVVRDPTGEQANA